MKKKISVLSATQIKLFRECPRLWIERYIFGHKLPSTKEMDEGLEVHQAIEAYLKTGKLEHPKWPNLLAKIHEYLSKHRLTPQFGVQAEKPIRIKLREGVWFTGAIDILDSRQAAMGIATIYDIKSKNKLDERYLLNSFQLTQDVQLALYAWDVMRVFKIDAVDLIHIYALRDERQPEVRPVPTRITRQQVEEVMLSVLETADKMLEYANLDLETSLAVPGNEESCFAYGKPCHYIEQCSPQSDLVGLRVPKKESKEEQEMANEDQSLLEELRAKRAGKGMAVQSSSAVAPAAAAVTEVSLVAPGAPPRETPKPTETKAEVPEEKAATKSKKATATAATAPTSNSSDEVDRRVENLCRVYVGCLPMFSEDGVTNFSDWVRPIEDAVAKKLKLPHWKASQFISHGEAAMTVAIREALGTLPRELFLSGTEPSAEVFLSCVPGRIVTRRCY